MHVTTKLGVILVGSLGLITSVFADQTHHIHGQGHVVKQTGKDFSLNTLSGIATQRNISMYGLKAIARKGEYEMHSYWEAGGFRPTIKFNDKIIVDGKDIGAVSRIGSFRFDRTGSFVYTQINKGPKTKVKLIQDGNPVLEWPRLKMVKVLAYDHKKLTVAVFEKKRQATAIYQYRRTAFGEIDPDGQLIGELHDCSLLSAKTLKHQILLQVYCDIERGSDVVSLDISTGKLTPVLTTDADEIIATQLSKKKGAYTLLAISGDMNARQAFHAVSGALLSNLGEPMSYASDEAGKQSWGQSYRTLTLATLFDKTQHPAFAELAQGAMRNTLTQTNSHLGIGGELNPSCGWASRIYSTDKRAPISFMINQAMISGSLLRSCEKLGKRCPRKLQQKVFENASCLVRAYEPFYEEKSKLYRIPFGAAFRFDGIWAPWNWQMTWAIVLDKVGVQFERKELSERAVSLAEAFLGTWGFKSKGAIWRYWTPQFYEGWTSEDEISIHIPTRAKQSKPKRYEDINHAGLSLMGLAGLDLKLPKKHRKAVERTLDNLLAYGSILPRDMDGKGPRTPRWLPGAGWDSYPVARMKKRYSRLLPGAVSGDQHLAYATLFEPHRTFDLQLTAYSCRQSKCNRINRWAYTKVSKFLDKNPLFTIDLAADH